MCWVVTARTFSNKNAKKNQHFLYNLEKKRINEFWKKCTLCTLIENVRQMWITRDVLHLRSITYRYNIDWCALFTIQQRRIVRIVRLASATGVHSRPKSPSTALVPAPQARHNNFMCSTRFSMVWLGAIGRQVHSTQSVDETRRDQLASSTSPLFNIVTRRRCARLSWEQCVRAQNKDRLDDHYDDATRLDLMTSRISHGVLHSLTTNRPTAQRTRTTDRRQAHVNCNEAESRCRMPS